MAFDSLLIHKCKIFKKTLAQGTAGVSTPNWTQVATNVKCRLDMKKGIEVDTGGGKRVKSSHILYLRYRNLTEKDYRIQIEGNDYNILVISKGGGTKHHLELTLERIY